MADAWSRFSEHLCFCKRVRAALNAALHTTASLTGNSLGGLKVLNPKDTGCQSEWGRGLSRTTMARKPRRLGDVHVD